MITEINYPASLPEIQNDANFKVVDPQLRTKLDSGRTMTRRKFSAVPVDFNAKWHLNNEQAIAFEAFYTDVLKDGSLWFNMPIYTKNGLINQIVCFVGAYDYEKIAPNFWQYSASMQIFLR